MPTKIEWVKGPDGSLGETWNPITGCTPISEGCKNCYARRMAARLRGRCGYPADEPFRVTYHPDRLEQPMKWQKPRRIFVSSMGDLFHPAVKNNWIMDVLRIISKNPRHIFVILTKRSKRLREFFTQDLGSILSWPSPNIWLGVTVEGPDYTWRIDDLLSTPAAVRFVSYEPALGPVDLRRWIAPIQCDSFDTGDCDWSGFEPELGDNYARDISQEIVENRGWVAGPCPKCGDIATWCDPPGGGLDLIIAGGESGPGARPSHPDWFRSVRDQCVAAGVAFFFKQWGEWTPYLKGTARRFIIRQKSHNWVDAYSFRVGKKAAGRLLDGREWNEMPGGER